MSDVLAEALNAVVKRIGLLAVENPDLRAELRRLASAVLAATEEDRPGEPAPSQSIAEISVGLPEASPATQSVLQPLAPEPLPDVSGILVPVGRTGPETASDADLSMIETRCRLKADGARWAVIRHCQIQELANYHTEIEPKDREIIENANSLQDCLLWMNHLSGPSPSRYFEHLACCFEAVTDGLALVGKLLEDLDGNREFFQQSLDLLAEAQSALRSAVTMVDGPRESDQQRVYSWLRATAAERRVFIRRYLRVDDPADPTTGPEIRERIHALRERFQEARQRTKQRQARIKQLRYHAIRIENGSGTEHDWKKVAQAVEEIIADGVPPSNREVRELLLPIIEEMPDLGDPSDGLRLVLREIDRYLAARPTGPTDFIQEPSAEVTKVAKLLRGKNAVLIGGDRRSYAHAALKSAFDLKDLIWVETREHEPTALFKPFVARKDVALVMLAIRWSSHLYTNVRQYCGEHNKPLVRLPGGYNPNQVAFQVLQQSGLRLGNGTN